jgi:hypothetical protein
LHFLFRKIFFWKHAIVTACRQGTSPLLDCSTSALKTVPQVTCVAFILVYVPSQRLIVMKTLTDAELRELLGTYVSPIGLYQHIKSLPFLGSLSSNVSSLTAGEWTEIVITYTVGGSGLADGAWIKGTFKFYSVSIAHSALLLPHCLTDSDNL